ncbi:CPBP family intramembrane glutamic endopeptidase [Microlunatus sp. Gsoil 973]|uniref:CPBP family intramembrane glutamic endopeptidase n=1 Tax=Microlunatus sp. Gsoil 973 TaxID=2672569 RepID=UPI001E38FD74|nr:CPBP family intramembrane glutamic endopeptidase [Microlunatus sp. Gsoil 973]
MIRLTIAPRPRAWIGAEVLIVLGLSLGQSAIYSILSILDRLTRPEALSQQSSQLNSSVTPDRPWLDLSYQIVNIAFPLVPVALVLYLLAQRNAIGIRSPFRLIGFDLHRPAIDLGLGALLALCIGIPGLGLYLGARALGLNTQVQASGLADNWWTIPVLVLSATQNAVLEEVIMLGFLYTRFRQLNWAWPVIIIVSAVIRGSYHLYQGFGGFAGNLIMGVIFGLVYLKWRRVMPLIITHTLLDVSAFVGYALLAPHVSWL